MKSCLRILSLALALCLCAVPALAGFGDVMGQIEKGLPAGGHGASHGSSLSNSDVTMGLKEALAKGTTKAVNNLGRQDGYLANKAVKILLPESLQNLEGPLRLAGQGQLIDDLVLAMNRAAEKAVPQAADILGDAVRAMSVSDAHAILSGPDDAATKYFRKTSGDKITEMMKPIIAKSTESTGVSKAYKRLTANPLAASAAQAYGMDLDSYVNKKAQDGLFYMIAVEEKDIRKNPAARTTDILKKVFGR